VPFDKSRGVTAPPPQSNPIIAPAGSSEEAAKKGGSATFGLSISNAMLLRSRNLLA